MRVYLSHPIRAQAGDNATKAEMRANCERAIEIGEWIRTAIPGIDLYIPGEHEDFVQLAYDGAYLTEKQILEIDCQIISSCDAVIIFWPDYALSPCGGCLVEYEYANAYSIPVMQFAAAEEAVLWLRRLV